MVKQARPIKQQQVKSRVLIALDAQYVILHRLSTAQKTALTSARFWECRRLALSEIGQRRKASLA